MKIKHKDVRIPLIRKESISLLLTMISLIQLIYSGKMIRKVSFLVKSLANKIEADSCSFPEKFKNDFDKSRTRSIIFEFLKIDKSKGIP